MWTSEDIDDKKVRFQWKLSNKVSQLLILLLLINCREQSECPRIKKIKCDGSILYKSNFLYLPFPNRTSDCSKTAREMLRKSESNGITEPINCKSVEKGTPQRP